MDRPPADVQRRVAEQRREDHEEHEREGEREKGRRGVAPEGLVHVTDLGGQAHERLHRLAGAGTCPSGVTPSGTDVSPVSSR